MTRLRLLFLGLILGVSTTAAAQVAWSTVPLPVQAAVDHKSITYFHDPSGWHVQSFFCPRIDTTVVTGHPSLPCVSSPVVDIANPGGAFATKLIADAKLTVLAAGFASGD